MMRYFSLYFVLLSCLLLSCSRPLFFNQPDPEPGPTIVRLDSMGQLTQLSTGKIKFKGPVTIQHGTGNVATTTKTDNTGRDAESGANGGHAVTESMNDIPVWAIMLLVVICIAVVGVIVLAGFLAYRKWWPRIRLLLFLLLLFPVTVHAEKPRPKGHYSYRSARQVERRYNRVVRYYNRQNRQDARDLKRDRKIQARRLKRDHP